MATIPNATEPLVTDGKINPVWYQAMKKLAGEGAGLSSGKASVSQSWEQSWIIEYPEAKDYRVVINAAVARTITSVTTISSTGTCTLTVKINTTALGGTANSVSTSEQTQAHSTANVMAAGDDLVLTVSSVSGAENVSVTIAGTLTLA